MKAHETKKTWSVIVPCFNEEGNIKKTVQNIITVLEQIAHQYELIPIDDGSRDNSPDVLRNLSATNSFINPIYHSENKGLGCVLRTGYFKAQYENVISIAGDGQFDPNELIPVSPVPEDTIIAFYREENLTYDAFRNSLSFLHKLLNKYLIGLDFKDINWAIVLKRSEFDNLNLRLKSSLIKSEICAKMTYLGYRVKEVPSVYHTREFGESKGSSGKMVFQAARDVLKLTFSVFIFRLTHKRKYS